MAIATGRIIGQGPIRQQQVNHFIVSWFAGRSIQPALMASGAIFTSHRFAPRRRHSPDVDIRSERAASVAAHPRRKINDAFDQEFSDHYTRIYDGFPDLSVLAAHQLISASIRYYGANTTQMSKEDYG